MLMTVIKEREEIIARVKGNVFVIACYGCKEVNLSEAEHQAEEMFAAFQNHDRLIGVLRADYICNPAYMNARLEPYAEQIAKADTILVLSCGVGVQTVAEALPEKRVIAGCDTYALPGFQGVTPLEHDCGQCGQCYLNLTGGICPITACSKSLINGQCGGAKNGRCEVDPDMECGWERIMRRLAQVGRLDVLKCPVQVRDYTANQTGKK